MKITFLIHSCYFVELEHCALLFDYYEGDIPQTDKPLSVFASHSHGDHFSPKVFDLCREKNARYFLSDDIWKSRVPEELKEHTVFVSPHHVYQAEGVKISTLQSTDAGVAFLVECEGKRFYHAGDLNCWVWNGAPKGQNEMMKNLYRQELLSLSGIPLDVAFVPLDPRQEEEYDLGMKYFFETADAEYVFPMHMWEDYSVVPRFCSTPGYEEYAKHLMHVVTPGQVFEL